MEQETEAVAESKIVQDEYPRPSDVPAKPRRPGLRTIYEASGRLLWPSSQTEAAPPHPHISALIRTQRGLKCSTCGCDQRMLCFRCRKGGYCPHCSVTLLLSPPA